MPSILFVCTGNLYRSPLAAAFFYKKLQNAGRSGDWIVECAGTWATPGQAVPPELVLAAQNLGVDLTGHISRLVDTALLTRHDLILVMENGHREALGIEFPFVQSKIHLLSEVVDGLTYDIADPVNYGQEIDEFASELIAFMERGYQKIYELAEMIQLPKS